MQVERIDLFQLHTFMPSGMEELDWLETFMKLRREGKIDRITTPSIPSLEYSGLIRAALNHGKRQPFLTLP